MSWFILVLTTHGYLCAGLCLSNRVSDALWTRVCSPKHVLLPHQRKPLSCQQAAG